jgi:hypothetical protein
MESAEVEKSRYFVNNLPLRTVDAYPNLIENLKATLHKAPPDKVPPQPWQLRGLLGGPTSIALLFYRLSTLYPDLEIEGRSLIEWAKAYLHVPGRENGIRHDSVEILRDMNISNCGVRTEDLVHPAVEAVVNQDPKLVDQVCAHADLICGEGGLDEWIFGRCGYLYLLRLMKVGFSDNEAVQSKLQKLMERVADRIIATPRPWKCFEKELTGAGHGSIAMITQIALSTPEKVSQVQADLERILDEQFPSGNWPTAPGYPVDKLVQFCHGAPGIVISLQKIRPFFPTLHERIDKAIVLGRKCIWERGLLKKEPCLCHGITGNALALNDTAQFEHFLSHATLAEIERGDKEGVLEMSSSYVSLLFANDGSAWTWAVADKGLEKTFLGYTDI